MNIITLIGRLTKNPELKTVKDVNLCRFSLAVPRRYDRDTVDYFDIVAWRKLAENCERYLHKGHQAAVQGELRMRTYETRDGGKRTVYEIQADEVQFLSQPPRSKQEEKDTYDEPLPF